MSYQNNSKISNLNKQVEDTKKLLMNNCDKVIERDRRLSQLENKTNELTSLTVDFKKKSHKLKKKMWWKSKMCYIMIFILVMLFIIILIIVKTNK